MPAKERSDKDHGRGGELFGRCGARGDMFLCGWQITVTRMHHELLFRLRKLKEALYICQNPCINRDEEVEISATWSALAVAADCVTIH
ncbi:hypothetical protein M514_05767 [Trichuris suis]|uniref:Uncharacterized protein n=1 Tax=Trichuris suis TaxID=68888 RepID=A0A085NA73_9BILA|nr:hypothetical protein M514_05767 [Trichuris suis]